MSQSSRLFSRQRESPSPIRALRWLGYFFRCRLLKLELLDEPFDRLPLNTDVPSCNRLVPLEAVERLEQVRALEVFGGFAEGHGRLEYGSHG